jgi:hypothetical protein
MNGRSVSEAPDSTFRASLDPPGHGHRCAIIGFFEFASESLNAGDLPQQVCESLS